MAKKPRRRRIWADDEKRMICRQALVAGVSVSQVARRYDVNANLVFNWLRDVRYAPSEAEAEAGTAASRGPSGEQALPIRFLPVDLIGAPGPPDAAPSACTSIPETGTTPGAAGLIEIELSGGHRLRITGCYDPDALARLLRGLST